MKKYQPTHFDDTVNLSEVHPLKEFAALLAKGLLLLAIIYLVIGATLEFFITRMSVEREIWLWNLTGIAEKYIGDEEVSETAEAQQKYAQKLFDRIPDDLKPEGYDFRVIIEEDPDPNAFALPGGVIIVTSGLLDELETENALTFVLGHELGHFKNRDHLRGMGFGFAGLAISAFLAGQDQGVVSAVSGLFGIGDLTYSRHMEKQADTTGLEALQGVYGHVGGATEFFEKIIHLEEDSVTKYIPAIMSTHPDSDKRIEIMKEQIKAQKLKEKQTRPIRVFETTEEIE